MSKQKIATILAVVAALAAVVSKVVAGGDLLPSATELSLAVSALLAAFGFQRA